MSTRRFSDLLLTAAALAMIVAAMRWHVVLP